MTRDEMVTFLQGLTRAELCDVRELLEQELRARMREEARPPDEPQRSGRGRIYIGGKAQ